MQEVVSILMNNAEGKILLQMRDSGNIRNPLKWTLFGGSVDEGEEPVAAAVRELGEELELEVLAEELELLGEVETEKNRYVYRLKRPLDWGQFAVREGAGAGFFTKGEALTVAAAYAASLIKKFVEDL